MTREEAIQYLSPIAESAALPRYKEALGMAIAALKEQGAKGVEIDPVKNEPLTLEELKQMNGQPIWVQFLNKAVIDRADAWFILAETGKCEVLLKGVCSVYKGFEYYGKSWIAYREPPK